MATRNTPPVPKLNPFWKSRSPLEPTSSKTTRPFLAQTPRVAEHDLLLGTYNGTDPFSCTAHEQRLVLMVATLGRVFNQCADTVTHTDVSMRCWLRSQDVHRLYKAPFDLVGRESTSQSYQRLMKRCVCFCFRLWRMSDEARQPLVKKTPTERECEALARVWEDDAWSAYPAEEAHETDSRKTTVRCPSTSQELKRGTDTEYR
jgi:hypothetical protein